MPYIKKEYRQTLNAALDELHDRIFMLPQEDINPILTYICYYLVKYYLAEGNWDTKSDGNKILDEASREYYRRIVAPYEDKAIERNGDIC